MSTRRSRAARFIVELPLTAPAGVLVRERPDPAPAALDASHALGGLLAAPTPERDSADDTASLAPPVSASRAALVLVVEDNADMRAFLCETLADEYRVESAANGREGFEQARRLKPDLVVTDIMMPDMSGEQLVQAMRHEPDLEATPVIVLTARAS